MGAGRMGETDPMPERPVVVRAALAILAISALSLLFIFSYAEALHRPTPHDVPVAVSAQVPAQVAAQLDRSPQVAVTRVPGPPAALDRIDTRDAYGAVVPGADGRSLTMVVAPAASAAIADFLSTNVVARLRAGGAKVTVRVVHPLPASDSRGLVGFYTVVGWAIAGYLGATLLGLVFGTDPDRRRTGWRFGALAVLGVIVGLGGAILATAIAGYDHGFAAIALVGLLTVLATGSVTIALQSLLGILGTGVAILLFVVFGNPSAGGPYAAELLPGLWRVGGQLLPTGAATTAVRDAAYFPDASLGGSLLVLALWIAAGVVGALLFARRGRGMGEDEAKVSLAGVA
jgi:hypothetical protein